jgi:hypothetical protein
MRRRPCIALLLLLGTAFPACARAGQPAVTFDGGTSAQHATVRAALAASSFPWEVVPRRVVIHVRPGVLPNASPGEIWLDGHLLDAGRFSWAVVQHEFAHQVDFFLLDDAKRASIAAQLGGNGWWAARGLALAPNGTVAHGDLTAERFASTLTWAYWPSRANVLRPESPDDESAALPPAAFRSLVASVLGLGSRRLDPLAVGK